MRIPVAARAAALLALLALPPTALAAQTVLGGGDDATLPRRGRARVRLGILLETATERFGTPGSPLATRQPLGSGASFDTLGTRFLPALAPLQDTLRLLAGDAGLAASLGALRTDVRVDVQTIPLTAEVGILDRVALSVMVPYVRTRSSVNPTVDPLGGGGNLGFAPTDGASLARNATLNRQLTNAEAALRALATTCGAAGATDPRCTDFPSAQATALLAEAAAFRGRVGYLYGTGVQSSGRPFVPVAGSPTQRAVEGRVGDLATRFRAFGIDTLAATSAPAGASARLGLGGVQSLLTGEAYGIAGDTLRGLLQSGTGDVELAASVQWLDTFRGDERARLAPSGVQLRSTLTAGYRLGVGSGDLPFYWFDVPTGSGVSALLLRSATDVVLGRRAWATAVVRVTQPFADEPVVRVPTAPGEVFVPAGRELTVSRQLGREVQVELTPRWSFGDYLGVWGQYRLRAKAADEYEGRIVIPAAAGVPETVIDAASLNAESDARDQQAGLGVTYSTVAAYARGRSNLPLEVSWIYRTTLAGAGGVPRFASQQVAVRLYFRVAGARQRGVSGVR
ncbi:hypothetical protein [Roseisolibacter sp. H3M3-2]|uniref:hypothetical protein n=1 Tax=Roseisolibacter sp. H3M3-2 TaxID=3031323 RepID=UPI0023DC2088|nr:hypothetical protein [Roseisolibacter sp. H3M3-2]MDF1502062.1 hypothetical protein [Roseisolibacter sp. H3M3-2]